jgi:ubiquinone/menaquinone biosynthesis C-methylase UbiE
MTPGTPYDGFAMWYDDAVRTPFYAQFAHPALLEVCGRVQGLRACDVACGTGAFARLLAGAGATVTGVDLSEPMLELARRAERLEPLGIEYAVDDAHTLASLPDDAFDMVTCSLGLTDIPDLSAAMGAMARLLRPGGTLTFSIPHPCFQLPHYEWATMADGRPGMAISGYFDEGHWRSTNTEGVRYRVGAHHRRLETYVDTLVEAGFIIERMTEPRIPEGIQDVYRQLPAFLMVRARKAQPHPP